MQKVDSGLWTGPWTGICPPVPSSVALQQSSTVNTHYMSSTHVHQFTCLKMEDMCFQFSCFNDVIVLSSDKTQDEEDKEKLIRVGREVRHKVRRRLLQNNENVAK